MITRRGTVEHGEAEQLIETTRAIEGVRDVVSLLREELQAGGESAPE